MTKEGVSVDPAKVEPILNWPRLTYVTKVRSFLVMVGYYRRFVERFLSWLYLSLDYSKRATSLNSQSNVKLALGV